MSYINNRTPIVIITTLLAVQEVPKAELLSSCPGALVDDDGADIGAFDTAHDDFAADGVEVGKGYIAGLVQDHGGLHRRETRVERREAGRGVDPVVGGAAAAAVH